MKVAAVILAGGLATRMGGGDKGLKKVAGQTLLSRIFEVVSPQVEQVVINANGDPARFAAFACPVISDTLAGHPGPLAGVLSAMKAMAEYDYILTVPTDTPFLPTDLCQRLSEPLKAGRADLTIARSGGWDHPVIGLWPTRLQQDLEDALAKEGVRKVKAWLHKHNVESVEWPIQDVDPFFNVNKPTDLDSLKDSGF